MTDNLLSGVERSERPRSNSWLWPLLPIAIATFALSALVAYQLHGDNRQAQSFLQRLVIGIYEFAGFVPSFFFFLLMLSWSSIWFLTGKIERPLQRVLRLAGLTLALAIWVNLQPDGAEPSPAAGHLGSWLGSRMLSLFGHFLSVVLVAPLTLGALLLATDFFFYRFFEGMHARLDQFGPQPSEGVESQVTEHLKGLSQVIAEPSAAASASSGHSSALAATVDAVVGDEGDEEPIVLRRLSSYERRQRAMASEEASPNSADSELDAAVVTQSSGEDASRETLAVGEDAASAAAGETQASLLADVPAVGEAGDGPDLGDDLAIAAAVAAEPVSTMGHPRRGRLAPIVAGEESQLDDSDAAVSPAEPAAEPESTHAHVDSGAADEAADRDEGGDAVESEAPADESPVAEPVAEVAPEDEAALAADAAAPIVAEPEPIGASEPSMAAAAVQEGDEDYFAASADEPPEVEPVIEVESGLPLPASHAPLPAADDGSVAADFEAVEEALAESAGPIGEPVIPIPRPTEGVRQQRLFVGVVDDSLVRDAIDIVTSTRRASATHLQRKLRVDYEQAIELLQVLAHRGLIELAEGESQGRVR